MCMTKICYNVKPYTCPHHFRGLTPQRYCQHDKGAKVSAAKLAHVLSICNESRWVFSKTRTYTSRQFGPTHRPVFVRCAGEQKMCNLRQNLSPLVRPCWRHHFIRSQSPSQWPVVMRKPMLHASHIIMHSCPSCPRHTVCPAVLAPAQRSQKLFQK